MENNATFPIGGEYGAWVLIGVETGVCLATFEWNQCSSVDRKIQLVQFQMNHAEWREVAARFRLFVIWIP